MYNVLVCDDEKDIVAALKIYLTADGYNVLTASNGEEAINIAAENELHCILLDIMMPVTDGISAASRLRETSAVPIIFLTAKSEDTDKVLGLNVGADDYVTKPFNPVELSARVRSQIRRYTLLGGIARRDSTLSIGGVTLDDETKSVERDGEPVALTPLEYDILKLLMSNPGKVFSSGDIYTKVWKDPSWGSESTVAVHIRHIREKLEINPAEPRRIIVVWGQGYKFASDTGGTGERGVRGNEETQAFEKA